MQGQHTAEPESELRFHELLVEAGTLRGLFDEQLEKAAGQKDLDRSDLPEHLLIGLSYLASIQHRAILLLLSQAWTSYAAEIQARGLLEFLAHVAFMLGKETDSPVGTVRQRAICLSLARSREEYQVLKAAEDAGKLEAGRAALALERVRLYEGLHRTEGCSWGPGPWPCLVEGKACKHRAQWPCRNTVEPRAQAMVRYTIELLGDRLKRTGLLDLYVTSSLLAHQSLLDRIFQSVGNRDLPSPAPYRYRATILAAALTAYGQGLGWILEFYSPEAARELGNAWNLIYQEPAFKEAASGAWDKTPGWNTAD